MRELHRILVEPIITEKSSEFLLDEKAGVYKYAFKVAMDANKFEIKQAIESRFNVKVDSVKTMVYRGKLKRMRQIAGLTSKWKKAYIKLEAGQSIAEFEGA
jgi:large subunit ribosomal protein L23